ncbi:MAG: NAD(P)/FAD-dependent oxidoreductase [Proteobacteria bacterium]|nr:NAD(P)/FAD-dependent oxidoreductase [Pseudomonadota bacterium]
MQSLTKNLGSYDHVVLGGGIGGVATAALLARGGSTVCVVERHNSLGGYAHSFEKNGYQFCCEVQYLMGCQPGGPIPRFLKLLGLEHKVKFNVLDPRGFDVIVAPDGRFEIPSGLEDFCARMVEKFPSESKSIRKYFSLLQRIFDQARGDERVLLPRDIFRRPLKHHLIWRYMNSTVTDVFDRFGFSTPVRTILAGQAGNLALGPSEASFLMHAGMQVAYCRSAAYPKLGMGHLLNSLEEVISQSPGCLVLKNCEVKDIRVVKREVDSIVTSSGVVRAKNYVSNLDPEITRRLMGETTPKYEYSDAVFTLYLGFKDIDLAHYGFGQKNFWVHHSNDIDGEFADLRQNRLYSKPWIFISTPSLLADPGVLTFVGFEHFKNMYDSEPDTYALACQQLEDAFLCTLHREFGIPLDKIELKIRQTPLDLTQSMGHPEGNVYGAKVTPKNYNFRRLTSRSGVKNLHYVGASSSYPGIMPIVVAAMELSNELIGRRLA